MERITYRITLDTQRNGIQRTLQGFETADNVSRRIEINLVAGGDTYELPVIGIIPMMYITNPKGNVLSINECTIREHTIIYDALPMTEEGIFEMQLKLIGIGTEGPRNVIASPKFAVEVMQSNTDDESIEQTASFTALENAVALAQAAYDNRLLKVELAEDCTFKAYFADGSIYESDAVKNSLADGNITLAESWAKGGTGTREGEDTNNSKYYSEAARSTCENTNKIVEEAATLLYEAKQHSLYTAFQFNFDTGELVYISTVYEFGINQETGRLEVLEGTIYNPDEVIAYSVEQFIESKSEAINEKVDEAINIAKGRNKAHIFGTTEEMNAWLSDESNKGILTVGDNLYIDELDVPDWWVSEVLEVADTDTGFYYKVAQLETQKVDLTEITESISELENSTTKSTTVKKIELVTELPDAGEEGTVYFTYEVMEE